MNIQILKQCIVNGSPCRVGETRKVEPQEGRYLIAMGKAQPAPPVAPKATPAKKAANPAQLRKQKIEK